MKEMHFLCGAAVGLVVGTLLYKHNSEARKIVNKCESTVAKKVEEAAENTESAVKKVTEQFKQPVKKAGK